MKSRDLALMRKEFKLDSYALPVKEVYNVYLKKDNGEIITQGSKPFELMDMETRELYLNNFKKALTGSIDSKIFELSFKNNNETTRPLLNSALYKEIDLAQFASSFTDLVRKNYNYDTDIVINFIESEFYSPTKNGGSTPFNFILCTIN